MLVVTSPIAGGDDAVEQVVERFAQLLRYIDVRLAHHLDGQRIEPLGIGAPNERCKAALICVRAGLPVHKSRTRNRVIHD